MDKEMQDIQIGDYIITDIKQTDNDTVTIATRKVDFSELSEENIKEFENMLVQMDLWESLISSVKTIKNILKEQSVLDIVLDSLYRTNKYDFESWIISSPLRTNVSIGTHIGYSKTEVFRITRGARFRIPITTDDVKNKLKNLEKWLAFRTVLKNFSSHILPAFSA